MGASPNILLVMSDQEQHWSLLPAGVDRPGLDWLRENGVGFTGHHAVTLPCGPSRSTIYTGRHTPHTRVIGNPSRARGIGMSSEVATIGSMLREQGYYTAYKGKWHVSVIDSPARFSASSVDALEDYGFSEYTPDGDPVGIVWDGYRQDPAIASDAANWLLGHSGRKPPDGPWFLAVNFVNPHDVMFFDATGSMNDGVAQRPMPRLPAPLAPLYRTKWDFPLPASFDEDLRRKPCAHAEHAASTRRMLGEIDDVDSWHRLRSYYFNCLRDLDQHVHTVLSALTESGHDRDTVVVYTTDHGEAGGAHGLREKPTSLYREVVNVPLVIAHPDGASGAETSVLSSHVDLVPTMLAVSCGASGRNCDCHFALPGHDLSSVVADPARAGPRDEAGVLFCMSRLPPSAPPQQSAEHELRHFMRGIFDGRWKLARYFAAQEHNVPRNWDALVSRNDLELYDTIADPGEMSNLAYLPEQRATMLDLVDRMNTLLADEVGLDDGSELATSPAGDAPGRPTPVSA